jgi:hypothetical protein
VPAPDDNAELCRAIAALTHVGSPEAKRAFYDAFLDSTLLVPSTEDLGYLDHYGPKVPDIELIPLAKISGPGGEVIQPVFTVEQALQTWLPGGCPQVRLGARTLLDIVLQSDDYAVVIDPAGGVPVTLERWEIRTLAEGRIPVRASAEHLAVDPRVIIQQVVEEVREAKTNPPDEWVARVASLLGPYAEVVGAHLVEVEIGGASPGIRCIVRFDPDTDEDTTKKVLYFLNTRVPRTIAPGVSVEFMTSTNDDILWTCQVIGLKVYERPA